MILHLFSSPPMPDARDMHTNKRNPGSLALSDPRTHRSQRLLAILRRMWGLYWNTPIGCEITARWIRGENPRDR
jgi:hypothetical protein